MKSLHRISRAPEAEAGQDLPDNPTLREAQKKGLVGVRPLCIVIAALALVAAVPVLFAQTQPARGTNTYGVALDGLLRDMELPDPAAVGVIREAFRAGWEARGVLARCDAEGMSDAACANRLRQHLRQRFPR